MGTTLAELLQHAQAQQQIERGRMDNVASGAPPGPPTPDVQAIQARVAAGTQNQGAIPGEVNPADAGIIGGIAKLLAPMFAGASPSPQQGSPQAPPEGPKATPEATPQPSQDTTDCAQWYAEDWKHPNQPCPQ